MGQPFGRSDEPEHPAGVAQPLEVGVRLRLGEPGPELVLEEDHRHARPVAQLEVRPGAVVIARLRANRGDVTVVQGRPLAGQSGQSGHGRAGLLEHERQPFRRDVLRATREVQGDLGQQ